MHRHSDGLFPSIKLTTSVLAGVGLTVLLAGQGENAATAFGSGLILGGLLYGFYFLIDE